MEMTRRERSNLLMSVANALETAAEEAARLGNYRFAENSISLCNIINGCATNIVAGNLEAGELLLQQGISLLASFQSAVTRKLLQ